MEHEWKPREIPANEKEWKKYQKQNNMEIQLFEAYQWQGINKWNFVILSAINLLNILLEHRAHANCQLEKKWKSRGPIEIRLSFDLLNIEYTFRSQ